MRTVTFELEIDYDETQDSIDGLKIGLEEILKQLDVLSVTIKKQSESV